MNELSGGKLSGVSDIKPLVSIVIPCYNSERYIEKCLWSLVLQETSIPYEIIVVDSSKDSTPLIIEQKFPSVKLIRRTQRTLPGEGRNIGVAAASGDIIAFIDSDCIASKNWLESAVNKVSETYPVVGGSVRNANPQTLISIADYILAFNEFLPSMPGRKTTFMPTCNLFCQKKAFDEIGGFRADLLAGEDTLFNYEMAKKYRLLFNPEIKISHHNRDNFRNFYRHHYNFGGYSALLRKKIKLPGHIFAKYPLLALLVPFARTIRISQRMIRWNWKMLPQFVMALPLVFVGVAVWSWGFIKEAFGLSIKSGGKK